MIEEIGVEAWSEMRERNVVGCTSMKYLLGLCVERERNGRVIEGMKLERLLRECLEGTNEEN